MATGGRPLNARDAVLARVREALGPSPAAPEIPRLYRAAGAVEVDVERFCERVADYRATVHRTVPAALADAVRELCPGRAAVAPGAPCAVPGGVVDDPPLSVADLDGMDTVLTGCALAIAETGTIVLDGGPASGRRALTLVPDHHVCVVRADQVVAAVPDAIAALRADAPLTFISGPSATSDIELNRVEGVHGPRRLDVVVIA
jgi:L-lactate dehydrogenase complex protein LldG